jgi:hypothetical protein
LLREIAEGLARREPHVRIYERHKDQLRITVRQFNYLIREHQAELNALINGAARPSQFSSVALAAQSRDTTPSTSRGPPKAQTPVFIGPDKEEKYRDFHFEPLDAYRKNWGIEETSK